MFAPGVCILCEYCRQCVRVNTHSGAAALNIHAQLVLMSLKTRCAASFARMHTHKYYFRLAGVHRSLILFWFRFCCGWYFSIFLLGTPQHQRQSRRYCMSPVSCETPLPGSTLTGKSWVLLLEPIYCLILVAFICHRAIKFFLFSLYTILVLGTIFLLINAWKFIYG